MDHKQSDRRSVVLQVQLMYDEMVDLSNHTPKRITLKSPKPPSNLARQESAVSDADKVTAVAKLYKANSIKKEKNETNYYKLFASKTPMSESDQLGYAAKNNIDSQGRFQSTTLTELIDDNTTNVVKNSTSWRRASNMIGRRTAIATSGKSQPNIHFSDVVHSASDVFASTEQQMPPLQKTSSISKEEKNISLASQPPLESSTLCLFYGSVISLQATCHPRYLSYDDDIIQADSVNADSEFTRVQLAESLFQKSEGMIKFGDMVYLRCGKDHIIGTSFLDFNSYEMNSSRLCEEGDVKPILMKISKIAKHKLEVKDIEFYGRWKILKRERTQDSLGEIIFNKDEVIFEQDGFYLSSDSPWDLCYCAQLAKVPIRHSVYTTKINPEPENIWRIQLLQEGQQFEDNSYVKTVDVDMKGSLAKVLTKSDVRRQSNLFKQVKHQMQATQNNNKELLEQSRDNLRAFNSEYRSLRGAYSAKNMRKLSMTVDDMLVNNSSNNNSYPDNNDSSRPKTASSIISASVSHKKHSNASTFTIHRQSSSMSNSYPNISSSSNRKSSIFFPNEEDVLAAKEKALQRQNVMELRREKLQFRQRMAAKLIQRVYRLYLKKKMRLKNVFEHYDREISSHLMKQAKTLREQQRGCTLEQALIEYQASIRKKKLDNYNAKLRTVHVADTTINNNNNNTVTKSLKSLGATGLHTHINSSSSSKYIAMSNKDGNINRFAGMSRPHTTGSAPGSRNDSNHALSLKRNAATVIDASSDINISNSNSRPMTARSQGNHSRANSSKGGSYFPDADSSIMKFINEKQTEYSDPLIGFLDIEAQEAIFQKTIKNITTDSYNRIIHTHTPADVNTYNNSNMMMVMDTSSSITSCSSIDRANHEFDAITNKLTREERRHQLFRSVQEISSSYLQVAEPESVVVALDGSATVTVTATGGNNNNNNNNNNEVVDYNQATAVDRLKFEDADDSLTVSLASENNSLSEAMSVSSKHNIINSTPLTILERRQIIIVSKSNNKNTMTTRNDVSNSTTTPIIKESEPISTSTSAANNTNSTLHKIMSTPFVSFLDEEAASISTDTNNNNNNNNNNNYQSSIYKSISEKFIKATVDRAIQTTIATATGNIDYDFTVDDNIRTSYNDSSKYIRVIVDSAPFYQNNVENNSNEDDNSEDPTSIDTEEIRHNIWKNNKDNTMHQRRYTVASIRRNIEHQVEVKVDDSMTNITPPQKMYKRHRKHHRSKHQAYIQKLIEKVSNPNAETSIKILQIMNANVEVVPKFTTASSQYSTQAAKTNTRKLFNDIVIVKNKSK